MLGIIDTSSLMAIARYYLSIKDEAILLRFLENKFRSGELVLLDTIHSEASRAQKGLATSRMSFLNDYDLRVKDSELVPSAPRKFSNQMDNNFCVPLKRKMLDDEAYAILKEQYLQSGDGKIIVYALNNIAKSPIVITEETPQSNDGKLFRKIPTICDFLKISHMSVAEWLSSNGVTLNWNHPE